MGRQLPPIPRSVLLRMFPFGMLLNEEMRIIGAGEKLLQAWGGKDSALNKPVSELFKLRRPKGIAFNWATVSLTPNGDH